MMPMEWVLFFCDESHLVIQALLVFAIQYVSALVDYQWPIQRRAIYVSLAILIAYAGHLLIQVDLIGDIVGTALGLVRIVLVTLLAHNLVALPGMAIGLAIWNRLNRKLEQARWRAREQRRQRDAAAMNVPAPPPPPPEPREERVRREMEEANREYEQAIELLAKAHLEQDEREAALLNEKQKLLKKIHNALQ